MRDVSMHTYAYKVRALLSLFRSCSLIFFVVGGRGESGHEQMNGWMDGESDRGGTSFRGEKGGWAWMDGGKRDTVW